VFSNPAAAPPAISYFAIRYTWPIDSIAYTKITVERIIKVGNPPIQNDMAFACIEQDAGVGFYFMPGQPKVGCFRIGGNPSSSYRRDSSNSIDFYWYDRDLTAGKSPRTFHMLPDTAEARSRVTAAGLVVPTADNNSSVGNATDIYTFQQFARFQITFYLTNGNKLVRNIILPPVDLDPSPDAPVVPSPKLEAPVFVGNPSWSQVTTENSWMVNRTVSRTCFDKASLSYAAPTNTVVDAKLEYLIPGLPGRWTTYPDPIGLQFEPPTSDRWSEVAKTNVANGPAECLNGYVASATPDRCQWNNGWASWGWDPASRTISIWKTNNITFCMPRITGQSRTFRLTFKTAAGWGVPTQFTVTT